jgi:glycosyltransferase involved in cell wall biosynthesis
MLLGQRIAVVLPAYDAARTLPVVWDELRDNPYVDDVILVDDKSNDETIQVARQFGIHVVEHPANRGYGGNQKSCYAEALARGADIVVMLHPDHQYSTELVTALAAMVGSGVYDLVLASRITAQHNALSGGMPLYKFVANRILTLIENWSLHLKMSEYHSGYRAFSRRLLEALPLEFNSDDFVFDNQIIAQARWYGFRIGEISCPTRYDLESRSITFKRAIRYGWGVVATALWFRAARWGAPAPKYLRPPMRKPGSSGSPTQEEALSAVLLSVPIRPGSDIEVTGRAAPLSRD